MPLSTIDNTGLSQSQILSAINMPTGSVVQVVNNTIQTSGNVTSTTSNSLVATSTTLTITPQFSTSKILLLANATGWSNAGSTTNYSQAIYTIYNGSTNLAGTNASPSGLAMAMFYPGSGGTQYNGTGISMTYLDSPATTSPVTYTVYLCAGYSGCTAYWGATPGAFGYSKAIFTAMEIR